MWNYPLSGSAKAELLGRPDATEGPDSSTQTGGGNAAEERWVPRCSRAWQPPHTSSQLGEVHLMAGTNEPKRPTSGQEEREGESSLQVSLSAGWSTTIPTSCSSGTSEGCESTGLKEMWLSLNSYQWEPLESNICCCNLGGVARNTSIIFSWPVGTREEEAVTFGILRSKQNQGSWK